MGNRYYFSFVIIREIDDIANDISNYEEELAYRIHDDCNSYYSSLEGYIQTWLIEQTINLSVLEKAIFCLLLNDRDDEIKLLQTAMDTGKGITIGHTYYDSTNIECAYRRMQAKIDSDKIIH